MSAPLTPEEKTDITEAMKPLMTDIKEAMPHNTAEDVQTMTELVLASVTVGYKKGKEQTAALREELEEKDTYKAYYEAALKHCENYNKELEAVKKENEDIKRKHWQEGGITLLESSTYTELLEKVEQLEKASALFKEVPYGSAYVHVSDYCLAVGRILEKRDTLLSSRENKTT